MIKQVIVMRNDLNMRKGKMVAQGAHASTMFLVEEIKAQHIPGFSDIEQDWIYGDYFTKICLYVNSEEELLAIDKKAKESHLRSHLILDSGKTEFDNVPTYTCLALGPDESEKINKITGHLKLL